MPAQWTFWRPSRGAPRQDPTHTEHFTQDDLAGLVEALVREAIQNSLDEPATPDGPVRVRFGFSGLDRALAPERVAQYFGDLAPHLTACGIDFDPAAPMPYLVIEDFGTRGLAGDPAQSDDSDERGNFYDFWRNIGRTNKRSAEGGTWGLGKAVYPAVSDLRSFFGLSVRDEKPRTVLMGHSMLKMHGSYSPYGWWGHAQSDDFVLPVTQAAPTQTFVQDFGLERRSETGLSLVIPVPEPDITPDTILAGVLRQYFFAIASGRLSVTIDSPEGRTFVDRSTLDRLSEAAQPTLRPLLALSRSALNPGFVVPVVNTKPAGAPKWETCEIGGTDIDDLRRRFERGESLAFSVPVTVRPVRSHPRESSMRVYLMKENSGRRDRPLFIRGGILIPHATDDRLTGVRALAVVQDPALAAFVRDSENPSHTEWRRDSTHFRGRYEVGPSTLAFIKQAPAQLYARLAEAGEERDAFALADLFHMPRPDDVGLAASAGAGEGIAAVRNRAAAAENGVLPDLPRQPFEIRKLSGGFAVTSQAAASIPAEIEVCVAYMTRDGARRALDQYHPLDFCLSRMPVDVQGARVVEKLGNRMVLADAGAGFRISASGFDTLRDLVVKVTPIESASQDEALADVAQA